MQTQPVARSSGPVGLVSIELDQRPIPRGIAGETLTIDTAALPDGPHVLRLVAEDRSWRRNRGVLEVLFTSDNTPPALTVAFLTPAERLRAGNVAAARLSTNEPASVQAEWGGATLTPIPLAAGAHLVFLAAPVTATSAPAPLTVAGRDPAGNSASHRAELAIEGAVLPRQNLLVPASLAALATGPVAVDESARLVALTSAVRPERLWSGEFRPPLSGPRTTGFGDRRDYADGHVAFHGGYDVAVPERTPVLAAAGGVVVFAGPLPQRGTTIVLDHGWGIYTVYGHLSEMQVAGGQTVAQGQTVGLVGSTGLSTGPHLHWEVRLRGLAVDPDSWISLSRALP